MTQFNLCDQSLEELTIGTTHLLAENTGLIRSADQRLQIGIADRSCRRECTCLEVCTDGFGNTDRGRGNSRVLSASMLAKEPCSHTGSRRTHPFRILLE